VSGDFAIARSPISFVSREYLAKPDIALTLGTRVAARPRINPRMRPPRRSARKERGNPRSAAAPNPTINARSINKGQGTREGAERGEGCGVRRRRGRGGALGQAGEEGEGGRERVNDIFAYFGIHLGAPRRILLYSAACLARSALLWSTLRRALALSVINISRRSETFPSSSSSIFGYTAGPTKKTATS